MKKDINIQIIRIIAMLFILLCHFFNEIGNKLTALGQFFNVGVFIFFIISAYLYGKKNIQHPLKWLINKFLQICIPIYIWLIFVNVIYRITNANVKYINNLFYILNIQAFANKNLLGLEHLWFISLILIMYLITPCLNKAKNLKLNRSKVYTLLVFQILSFIVLSLLNEDVGRYIFYIFIYINVYFASSKNIEIHNKYLMIASFIVAIIFRVGLRSIFDNTIIYSNFVVLPTQTIIAISIFTYLKNLDFNIKRIDIINWLDGITYYIYIVHYIFCVGPLKIVHELSIWYPVQVIGVCFLSIVFGTILKNMTEIINKKIVRT